MAWPHVSTSRLHRVCVVSTVFLVFGGAVLQGRLRYASCFACVHVLPPTVSHYFDRFERHTCSLRQALHGCSITSLSAFASSVQVFVVWLASGLANVLMWCCAAFSQPSVFPVERAVTGIDGNDMVAGIDACVRQAQQVTVTHTNTQHSLTATCTAAINCQCGSGSFKAAATSCSHAAFRLGSDMGHRWWPATGVA